MRVVHIVEKDSQCLEDNVERVLRTLSTEDECNIHYSSAFNGYNIEYSALVIIKERG